MYRYIISRILLVFPTLIGAAALVFLLMRLVPGDICLVRLGSGGTSFTQASLASCHAEIGIDRPWILQFIDFLWGLARLDFGNSMWSGKPVIMEIATRFPISLEVAIMATVIAVVIALPVVTVIGIEFAFLIGGLVVTEQVFNLNGIGRLMVLSVQNQDYTLTQALVMVVVTIAVLSNLVVDLLYAWFDPRIRLA